MLWGAQSPSFSTGTKSFFTHILNAGKPLTSISILFTLCAMVSTMGKNNSNQSIMDVKKRSFRFLRRLSEFRSNLSSIRHSETLRSAMNFGLTNSIAKSHS